LIIYKTKNLMKPTVEMEQGKKKEIIPPLTPPIHPPIKPEVQPGPGKEEPYHPMPETPGNPEPKTYPGKEQGRAGDRFFNEARVDGKI
jgi:hypothetical protein